MKKFVTKFAVTMVATSVMTPTLFAKDVKLSSAQERMDYIKQADVWQKPSWIADDFSFDPSFDLKDLGVSGAEKLLTEEHVACQITEELATEDRGNGKSPKFSCLLMSFNHDADQWELVRDSKGKTKKIKVKYGSNPEVQGEVIASRLLWALGFGADRMYPVKYLSCFGCSSDPWNVREMNADSLKEARVFTHVAIEQKIGEEIEIKEKDLKKPGFVGTKSKVKEGWSYAEILSRAGTSSDPVIAREQVIERDALLILAAMIRHADNKSSNQRLICEGKVSDEGKCLGTTRLIIHDVGYTFGWGQVLVPPRASRVELKPWRAAKIWSSSDEKNSCRLSAGIAYNFRNPVVTEEARELVAQLLSKFSEGEIGRKRVENLFRFAAVEEAGRGKPSKWADVFMDKVAQIENPALSDDSLPQPYLGRYPKEIPVIRCEKRADDVVKSLLNR